MKVPQISKSTYNKICSLKLDYEKTFNLLDDEKLTEIEIEKGKTYTFIIDNGNAFDLLIDVYVSGLNTKRICCSYGKKSSMGKEILKSEKIKYVVAPNSHSNRKATKYMQELLDKYYTDFDEKAKEELIKFYGTKRYCHCCGTEVITSDLPQYPYLCIECDENMFEFETFELLGS